MSRSIRYYDSHAAQFAEGTLGVDMSDLHRRFLAYVPARGLVLEAGCGAAHAALRHSGLFAFSVEDAGERAPDGHVLNPHGRYAHSAPYVRSCLEAAGFKVLNINPAVLRSEGGK